MLMELRASDFDYPLDADLIAQQPAARRDDSRLMVLSRATGQAALHSFADLPNLLRLGDLLVVNNTRVSPARFFCRRSTGGKLEGLFLREQRPGEPGLGGQQDGRSGWLVLLKGAHRCQAGERLSLVGAPGVEIELVDNRGQGEWLVRPTPDGPAAEILAHAGQTPLPPYIRRTGGGGFLAGPAARASVDVAQPSEEPAAPAPADFLVDRDRYQTVYASADGAVAAPTAGLHFTPEILATLAERGIAAAAVTLHVGLGTFLPVKVEDLAAHRMHSEWYELPPATAAAINAARGEGRRIVAVGTTSVRVLETAAGADGFVEPGSGWTDIFIYPPARFRSVDALITNFHLPKSTLLMLVSAFCSPGATGGIEMIRQAYARAAAERFRFFSYGDAMLIE
jgi:S-adenosylmethionine:tRNA ribosyltransferase-isomerase